MGWIERLFWFALGLVVWGVVCALVDQTMQRKGCNGGGGNSQNKQDGKSISNTAPGGTGIDPVYPESEERHYYGA